MNIKSLAALIKLAENDCNFGIHKQLGIPRSTLWAYINDLERATNFKLIIRKKRNNVLTEEGKNFIPYAQQMLKLLEEGIESVGLVEEEEPSGKLTISTTSAVATSWLMPSIHAFQEKFPGIRLNIIASDSLSTATEMLADILMRPMGKNPFLQRKWSVGYRMGLFASKSYLEKHGTPQCVEDLVQHSFLSYGEHAFSGFPDVDWHVKGRWLDLPRLTPRLTINSTIALYQAAREGIGICSAATQSNIFYQGGLVRVLPFLKGPYIVNYFCVKKNMHARLRRNIRVFEDCFTNYLQKNGVQLEPVKDADVEN